MLEVKMNVSAHQLQEQGIALFQRKEYEAAARLFQQAMDAYEAEGKKGLVGEMQTNIGLVHRALGEHQQALETMERALLIFRQMGDKLCMAKVLGNLGGVYVALGNKEQAYNCYRQAVDIFDEVGEKKLYGETLLAMSDLQVRDGKLIVGAATYEAGLEQLGELTTSQKMIKGLLGFRNKLVGRQ
jgi:tetratricopeptide (TPR) repeat protein